MKIYAVLKKLGIIIIVLIVSITVYLAISGVPSPLSITNRGGVRVSWTLVKDLMSLSSKEARKYVFVSWYPNGDSMLILGSDAGSKRKYHTLNTKKSRLSSFNGLTKRARNVIFTDNSNILYTVDVNGDEHQQIMSYDLVKNTVTTITNDSSQNVIGSINPKTEYLSYSSTRRNGRDRDVYFAKLSGEPFDSLVLKGGNFIVGNWSHDGQKIIIWDYVSVEETKLLVFDARSGSMMDIFQDENQKSYYGDAVWSEDDQSIIYITDRNSDFKKLHLLELKSGKDSTLTYDLNWDIIGFSISSKDKSIAIRVNESGYNQIYISLSEGLGKWSKFEKIENEFNVGSIGSMGFHPTKEMLAFTFTSALTQESDIYLYDTRLKKFTRCTGESAYESSTPPPRLAYYPTFDSIRNQPRLISAFLFEPERAISKKPYPVLVDIHGGPALQSTVVTQYPYEHLLRNRGFVVIKPNIRGSSGYGKEFLKLDNDTLRENAVKDIGHLLKWISTQKDYDSKRIFLIGNSYGGFMVLSVLAHYPESVAGGIDMFGITNFSSFLKNTAKYRQESRQQEYGDEEKPSMLKFLHSISPLQNVDKIKRPLLIYHGARDPRVPVSESREMYDKLKSSGSSVWYLEARNEGHGLEDPITQMYIIACGLTFIEELAEKK